jgi:hypothetical protein
MRVAAVAIAFAACAHPVSPSVPDLARAGDRGLRAMDAAAYEANVKFLSSDALAGRAPGSPGGRRAEAFMADQLAHLGLEPAGEQGTYFQDVPLREATRIDAGTSLIIHAGADVALESGNDVLLLADPRAGDVALDAPLVFVGYGIARPELGYDDLAGVDLHGAIALVFGGAPRELAGKPLDPAHHAVLSDLPQRTRALRDHGARAVIAVYDPVRATRMPFATWLSKGSAVSMAWTDHGVPASDPVLPVAVISEAALDRVLATTPGAPKAHALWAALDRGRPPGLALTATASLRVHATVRDLVARNVIARLPGADPAAGVVVITAHLDHLGIGPAIDGDTIYNGALDNASGSAGLIEVARAFAALPQRPRRGVLFVAVTGEEKGLLGSDYFAAHPVVPIDRIAADINIDGVGLLYEPRDVVALGAEHSTLAAHVAAAARALDLVVSPDPDPDQVFFIRSDQYSFVQRGIPAIFPGAGNLDEHGGTDANLKRWDAWSDQHYHRPSDAWLPVYRAAWGVKELQFDFLTALSIATAATRPSWNPGDVFARR